MLNKKVMVAAFAVLIMMAVPFAAVFAEDADAESVATAAPGTYSVYVYDGGSWQSSVVNAYDAAEAVKASSAWKNGDQMVPKNVPAPPGGYVTYNHDTYGNITKLNGVVNETGNETTKKVWNAYTINARWNVSKMTDNLGSYKCFSDYSSSNKTANILMYYGPVDKNLSDIKSELKAYSGKVPQSLITEVQNNDTYKVTFNLHIDGTNAALNQYVASSTTLIGKNPANESITINNQNLRNTTITVTGYGSDCYIALKKALPGYVNGTDALPGEGYSAYGWLTTVLGLGTYQIGGKGTSGWQDDTYAYWCIFDEPGNMADYVLGAYSPLSNAGDFSDNEFDLTFKEVIMTA